MSDTVRVRGASVPMSTQQPPPAPRPGFFESLGNVFGRAGKGFFDFFNQPGERVHERDVWGSMATQPLPANPPRTIKATPGNAKQFDILGQSLGINQQQVPTGLTAAEWIGQNMGVFDPSPYQFDSTPYDNYLNFLIQQDEETMARINAMYAQLADTAEANMGRISEIYDSGAANLGDVYGSAYGGIEDAYGSAQQQAADQMARLGIEAAAPAVIDPMALSQAEALSNIESQRAGGMGATEQYRTSAQNFGSQMQQVAQQQGLEVSNQILGQLTQRQAEAAFMRQQAEADAMSRLQQAQANFNPYANLLQQMQLENMYNEPMLQAEQQARQQAFEMAKLEIERRMQFDERLRRDVQAFMQAGLDYDQAVEAVMNLTGYNPYG